MCNQNDTVIDIAENSNKNIRSNSNLNCYFLRFQLKFCLLKRKGVTSALEKGIDQDYLSELLVTKKWQTLQLITHVSIFNLHLHCF